MGTKGSTEDSMCRSASSSEQEEAHKPAVTIREITVDSLFQPSSIPDVDYEINPYVGCVYDCLYCYARHVQDHSGRQEAWGRAIDVKTNAPDLIEGTTKRYQGKEVYIGSVTDPYLPCDAEIGLTRRILERLLPLKPRLSLQTKSDLVLRDLSLLRQFDVCEVGLTLTTLDDSLRVQLENESASIERRIETLRCLHEAGLTTYVFIGPLLPELTDWKAIMTRTSEFVDYYAVEILNIQGTIWKAMKTWLNTHHPALVARYEEVYFTRVPVISAVNRLSWRYLGYPLVGFSSFRHHLYDEIGRHAADENLTVVFNDLLYE